MTASDIKNTILLFTNDVILTYNGEDIFINPCSDSQFIFGYMDINKTYSSIDELMNDKVFNGKSLTEIASDVTY